METITNRNQLRANIQRLRDYLSPQAPENDFGTGLLERGLCFVVTTIDSRPMFAPSRFVGYLENDSERHTQDNDLDGRVTNRAIESILGFPPEPSDELELLYAEFVAECGGQHRSAPFNGTRKFWDIRDRTL